MWSGEKKTNLRKIEYSRIRIKSETLIFKASNLEMKNAIFEQSCFNLQNEFFRLL